MIAVLLALCAVVTGAGGGDVDAFLARLASAGKNVRALSGEFVQKKNVAAFKQELSSRGHFAFERPAHLEWRYTEPDPSTLVVDGDRATLTLPDEPPQSYDLARQPGLRALVRQMQLWLGGGADLAAARADYEMTAPAPSSLHLIPRAQALRARIRSIDLAFDPQTLLPRSARVVEKAGDTTAVTFRNLKRR